MEVLEDLKIGGLKIYQDTEEYRFTSDSVLLARFLKAKRKERVADFCAGSGIVGLHFFAENPLVESITLFEMQERLVSLCARTISLNGLTNFRVEKCRIQEIPSCYLEQFSLILCNPPYERGGFEKAEKKKAVCTKELDLSLDELALSASRCLKFGGRFALIHRADRVAEILYVLKSHRLEPKILQFVSGKEGREPYAVLVAAVKGGRPGTKILPSLVNEKEKK